MQTAMFMSLGELYKIPETQHMMRCVGVLCMLFVGGCSSCRSSSPTSNVTYNAWAGECDTDVFYTSAAKRETRVQLSPTSNRPVARLYLGSGERFAVSASSMGACEATCSVRLHGREIARNSAPPREIAVCEGIVPHDPGTL